MPQLAAIFTIYGANVWPRQGSDSTVRNISQEQAKPELEASVSIVNSRGSGAKGKMAN